MTTPSSPDAASRARSPGCGLKGCAIGCLAPIVIGALALALSAPYLGERWRAWQADNPWIEQVPGAVSVLEDVLGGLAESSTAGADTSGGAGGSGKRLVGVDQRSAMPGDLPLWPRPAAETFNVGPDHAAAYQRVRQPRETLLQFFRRAMPAQGWRLDREHEGAGGVLLLYRKGARIARVEVVADSSGADVWLRSRTPEVPAPGSP